MIKVTVEQVVGLGIATPTADLVEFLIQVREVPVEINVVGVAPSGQPVAFCLET